MAKLYFRYGVMNSGKSMELLKVAHNYDSQGKPIIVLTSALDDRFGQGIVSSRAGIEREALVFDRETNILTLLFDTVMGRYVDTWYTVGEAKEKLREQHCILIDEAQFLTREQVEQLHTITYALDVPVICFGLKNDFMNHLFEGSEALLTFAEKIEEIKTVCMFCKSKATMNLRKVDGHYVFDGEQVEIGGDDLYLPVCSKCYNRKKTESSDS